MMRARVTALTFVVAVSLGGWACDTNNPARPSMSFVAPVAQQPANAVAFNFSQQPITVEIINAVRTGGAAVSYNLEVSNNPNFGSLAVSREGIAEGDGVTKVQLPQLVGNTTYYWRWRAVVDGVAGEPSLTRSFFLRPNVVFAAPAAQTPKEGDAVFSARPTFTVTNAVVTGPAGTVFYDFQVSTSAAFGSLLAAQTVQQGTSTTSWTPTQDLPEGQLFWRVRAKDPSSDVTGPFTNALSFERRFGIDLPKAVIAFGPSHVATWPETARLTSVYFKPDETDVMCTEYDDPGWPEVPFFDTGASVYSNQWVFVNHQGTWYGGAAAWMRPWPQFCKKDYDQAFFQDSLGGAFPFNQTVLHTGDVIGVMITSPARAWPDMKSVDQRSNIMMVGWPEGR